MANNQSVTMSFSTITIVGAGTMGANIALSFASARCAVRLHDVNATQLENALALIRANAAQLHEHGLLDESVDDVVQRVEVSPTLESAVRDADLVIEAVPENLQLKWRIFTELDRVCGATTILASNTSSFVPSSLATGLVNPARRQRFLVMHYWNPAHLMPLVELVPHAETLPVVVERVRELLLRCAKQPVVLRKEIAGFIGNRLAFALQREAMDLVEKGVASPEDIDVVAKTSFGRRIPISGIFGTADLGGLDVYWEICRQLFPDLCQERAAPVVLTRLVESGRLGVKSGAGWHHYTNDERERLREAFNAELIHYLKRERRDVGSSAGQTE